MDKIIEVHGLQKCYGDRVVVDNINFSVEKGQFVSMLGVNGAGKSTTIDILCTLLKPDGGRVNICGYELGKQNKEIRSNIGIVFQNSILDGTLTVKENLLIRAKFYAGCNEGMERPYGVVSAVSAVNNVVETTKIAHLLNRTYGTLSGGEKRRVDIARALLHMPKVLFLDEPTAGLDPKIRSEIWQTIQELRRINNITVLCTTHYMEEVEWANQVFMMNQGKIILSGSPTMLQQQCPVQVLQIQTRTPNMVKQKLHHRHIRVRERNGWIVVPIENSKEAIVLLQELKEEIDCFEMKTSTMEDVFLKVAGGCFV